MTKQPKLLRLRWSACEGRVDLYFGGCSIGYVIGPTSVEGKEYVGKIFGGVPWRPAAETVYEGEYLTEAKRVLLSHAIGSMAVETTRYTVAGERVRPRRKRVA